MNNFTVSGGAYSNTSISNNRANNRELDALLNNNNSSSQADGFESLLNSFSGTGSKSKFNFSGISLGNIGAIFGMGGSDLYPLTLNNRAALEATIGSSGPLPTYLHIVSKARNFTAAQTQSLYEITARNMNIQNTPEAVHKLSLELQAAGLPA